MENDSDDVGERCLTQQARIQIIVKLQPGSGNPPGEEGNVHEWQLSPSAAVELLSLDASDGLFSFV